MFLYSCKKKEGERIATVHNIYLGDSLCFKLDSLTPNILNYFQIVETGPDTTSLVFYNNYSHHVYVYDLYRQNLSTKILIKNQKLNLVNFLGFHYISPDSIFFLPEYGENIYLATDHGHVDYWFPMLDTLNRNKLLDHRAFQDAPFIINGSNLLINNPYGILPYEGDTSNFLLLNFDLEAQKTNFSLQFSAHLKDKNYDNTPYRLLKYCHYKDDLIFYSFGFDPNLYVYDFVKKIHIDTITPKLNHFYIPKFNESMGSDEKWLIFQSSYSFSSIIYNKYNSTISRIILRPYDLRDLKSGKQDSEVPKKASLFTFDLAGTLQSKTDLDNLFVFRNTIVRPEGIYFQKINEDENLVVFQLVEF